MTSDLSCREEVLTPQMVDGRSYLISTWNNGYSNDNSLLNRLHGLMIGDHVW